MQSVMPESDKHRCLVKAMAIKFSIDVNMRVCADIDPIHGFPYPSKIAGYIPDIYAQHQKSHRKYICEVKTFHDLETQRSNKQINAFVDYINNGLDNVFILAGDAQTTRRARTILRWMVPEFHNCSFRVFDGLNYWEFNRRKEQWLLH